MRNYLYVWHDPTHQFLVFSGVLFSDLAPYFEEDRGLVLLKHAYTEADYESHSRFEFIPSSDVPRLAKDDIYSYGDFAWADFETGGLKNCIPSEIAELLYFAHTGNVLNRTRVASLQNHFLCFTHDDGWYLKIHYEDWAHAENLLSTILSKISLDRPRSELIHHIQTSDHAYWVAEGRALECEKTFDIDSVLKKKLP